MINDVINVALEAAQPVFCKEADVLPHPELIAAFETSGAHALSEDVCDLGELATASLDKSLTLLAQHFEIRFARLSLGRTPRRWLLGA